MVFYHKELEVFKGQLLPRIFLQKWLIRSHCMDKMIPKGELLLLLVLMGKELMVFKGQLMVFMGKQLMVFKSVSWSP